jgi:hypothetical protein
LAETDQVAAQLDLPADTLSTAARRIKDLIDAIKAHEAREEEVLSQGFNEDLNVPG